MKFDSTLGLLTMILLSMPNIVVADRELRRINRLEEVRQDWADVHNAVPPADYSIKIDDREFSFTIPQERTAATYNRKGIDTQYYREQIFGSDYRSEWAVGLFGFRRKDQTGIWPLVRSYGETSIGSGVFLPQDQTKSELFWADYGTLESLVKKTKGDYSTI